MLPILFTIGPFNVYSFGFFLSLAFIISTFLVWKYASDDLKEEEYLDAYLYTNIVILVIARISFIITNFENFGGNILKYIVVRETPGLSLISGLAGGIVFLYFYARNKKYDFWHLGDIFAIALSFSLFLSKIGEQLGGAGFGKATDLFWGVRIAGITGKHHPTEFYEALLFLILALILTLVYRATIKKKINGFVLCLFSLYVSLVIFLIEFLKDYQVYLYRLSKRQIGALILIILVLKPLVTRLVNLKKIYFPAKAKT